MNIFDEQRREEQFIMLYKRLIDTPARGGNGEPTGEVTPVEVEEYVALAEYFKFNGRLEILKERARADGLVDSN